MNVSFLNTLYSPDNEERQRLLRKQEEIHFEKVEYFREIRLRGYSPEATRLAKDRLHEKWRGMWEVIEGGEDDD